MVVLISVSQMQAHACKSASDVSKAGARTKDCFAPREDCGLVIMEYLNDTKNTLDIAMFSITDKQLGNAIVAAKDRGVEVRMVVDRTQSRAKHSIVSSLIKRGIDIRIKPAGGKINIEHNKFAVYDGSIVTTGSYNWTNNARKRNSENLVVLPYKKDAKNFTRDFEILWQEYGEKDNS